MKNSWYTILTCGGAYSPTPARGPFKSVEKAEEALENFRGRHGAHAGTWLAAGSTVMAGPYASRRAAQGADISTCTRIVSGPR